MTEHPLNVTQKMWHGNYPFFVKYFVISSVAALGYVNVCKWMLKNTLYCIKKVSLILQPSRFISGRSQWEFGYRGSSDLVFQFCTNTYLDQSQLQHKRVSITAYTVLSHLLLFMVMFCSQCHWVRPLGNSAAFKEFIIPLHIAEQNLSCYLKLTISKDLVTSQRLYCGASLRWEFCDWYSQA